MNSPLIRRAVLLVLAAGAILTLAPVWGSDSKGPTSRQIKLGPADTAEVKLLRRYGREREATASAIKRVPYLVRGSSKGKMVALTFDDGPGPSTESVVKQLRRLKVPATFFQVGAEMKKFPDVDYGGDPDRHFAFGNHTYSHAFMAKLKRGQQWAEIVRGASAVRGNPSLLPAKIFRPPYGSFNKTTHKLLRRSGELMVVWSVDPADYDRPGAKVIAKRVISAVRPGAIVLLHDGGGYDRNQTVAALPRIVRALHRRGYRFVTVPQMIAYAPPPRAQSLPRYLREGS